MKTDGTNGVLVQIGLGSNEGDRLRQLCCAVLALMDHPDLTLEACSRVWETEHVGPGIQEPYLNACLTVRTTLEPMVLLAQLKGIEAAAGRRVDGHGQPRPVDLDILLYGELVMDGARLTIPHPQLRERAFVLEPLVEIAGETRCPDSGETIAQACAKIRRKSGPWTRLFGVGDLLTASPGASKEEWRAALALHCR